MLLINDIDYKSKVSMENGHLKPLVKEDVHLNYIRNINDPTVCKYLVSVRSDPLTFERALSFVQSSRSSSSEVIFGVWLEGYSEFVGTIRVHSVELDNRTAEIGICIFDKNCWGKGLGKASIVAVTEWCHKILGIRWIEAGVYRANIASARLFSSAGYTKQWDIVNKYLYEGTPTTVEIYVSKVEQS